MMVYLADEPAHFFRHAGETIFQSQRSAPEMSPLYQWVQSTTEFDHVGVHPQLHLPRNSQDLPFWNAQVPSRLTDISGTVPRTVPSGMRLEFWRVLRVTRKYRFRRRGQSADRWVLWRGSASHRPFAC